MGIKSSIFRAVNKIGQHSGTICAILAIGGVIATAYFSGKAAVEVDHKVEPDMDVKDKAKTYAKAYWKTAVAGTATCALIFGSDRLHVRKEIGLAGLAAFWQKQNQDLEKKVVEKHGSDELYGMRKEVAEEEMKKNPYNLDRPLERDEFMVYCPYTNQYFPTTENKIKDGLLYANERLNKDYEVSLGDILEIMGGEALFPSESIGWNYENAIQNYNWGFIGGMWISLRKDVMHHTGSDSIPALFYEVDPIEQRREDMLFVEECP